MAELFGKAAGCSHGKGGSMHLFDASLGFLGGHGIVGGHIPLATGMAFAIKYRERATRSPSATSARRRSTTAPSTRRSTWRRSGSCRPSTSARTTATAWARPSSARARSTTSPSAPAPTTWTARWWTGRTCWRCTRRWTRAVKRARDEQAPHAARGPHLPLHGPLDVRPDPRPLPHPGRGRGAPEARPDRRAGARSSGPTASSTRRASRRWTRTVIAEVEDAYRFADDRARSRAGRAVDRRAMRTEGRPDGGHHLSRRAQPGAPRGDAARPDRSSSWARKSACTRAPTR